MTTKKFYVLRKGNSDTEHVFSGTSPRKAALKAATRGHTDIKLRERKRKKDGKWRVHVFKGNRKKVNAPKSAPKWLPASVWEPTVKKVSVEKLDKI